MRHLRRGLVTVACLFASTGVVSAHGPTAGSGISLSLVVVVSALAGITTGLVAVLVASKRAAAALTGRRFTLGLDAGLIVLGLSFLVPAVGKTPGFGLVGAGIGVVLARLISRHHTESAWDGHNALVIGVIGAIGIHRLFEGIVLAAGFVAGSTVGLASTVVITVHAAGETAVVGTLLAIDGRTWLGVVAVLAIQTSFVVAAIGAIQATVSVPTVMQSFVVTVAAGVLFYFGLNECRQCFFDRNHT